MFTCAYVVLQWLAMTCVGCVLQLLLLSPTICDAYIDSNHVYFLNKLFIIIEESG